LFEKVITIYHEIDNILEEPITEYNVNIKITSNVNHDKIIELIKRGCTEQDALKQ